MNSILFSTDTCWIVMGKVWGRWTKTVIWRHEGRGWTIVEYGQGEFVQDDFRPVIESVEAML